MKKLVLPLLATLYSTVLLAQEDVKKIDVDINAKGGGQWYASPWVWVVGAAVFILLLVALLRGGGGRRD